VKTFLLDTSFLIDLEDEAFSGEEGPATRMLERLGSARLYISPVTAAELLEGAVDEMESARALSAYHQTTIGWQADTIRRGITYARVRHSAYPVRVFRQPLPNRPSSHRVSSEEKAS